MSKINNVNYREFPFQCLMETNFTQGQRVFEYHVYISM